MKAADQFGNQYQHWNGFDLTVDARPRNGLFLQGGVSSGVTMTDNCEIVKQVPEALLPTLGSSARQGISVFPLAAAAQTGIWTPEGYCHQDSGWVTTYKALGSYGLPWDFRVSGTFQSVPGPFVRSRTSSTTTPTSPPVVFRDSDAPIFLNAGQTTIGVIDPGSQYGDRLNQVDFRVTKIFRMAKGSTFRSQRRCVQLVQLGRDSDATDLPMAPHGGDRRRSSSRGS